MHQACSNSAGEIEHEVSHLSEAVFNIVSKDPEDPHVPDKVDPAPVQKHGTEERQDLFNDIEMRGDGVISVADGYQAPSEHEIVEVVTEPDLVQEGQDIDDDDRNRHTWEGSRGYVVAERQHAGWKRLSGYQVRGLNLDSRASCSQSSFSRGLISWGT